VPHSNQLVIMNEATDRSRHLLFAAERAKFAREENLILTSRDERFDSRPHCHQPHIPRIFAPRSSCTVGLGFGVSPSRRVGTQVRASNSGRIEAGIYRVRDA